MKPLSIFLTYNKLHCLLALLTLSVSGWWCSVSAQPAARVSFSCIAWKPLAYENVYYKKGQQYVSLELLLRKRSKVHKLSGASTLDLYAKKMNERGKADYQLIGQGPLPENTKHILFFIVEAKEGSALPYSVWGVDDTMGKIPPGIFHIINFTDQRLQIHFGGVVTPLMPNTMEVVPSKVSSKGGLVPFVLKEDSGKKMYENRFFVQAHGRDVVFIFPKKSSNDRKLKLMHQSIPPVRKR